MKHKKEFEQSENQRSWYRTLFQYSRFFPRVLPNVVRKKAEVEEQAQKLKKLIEEKTDDQDQ